MFSDIRGDDSQADTVRFEAMPVVADFGERLALGERCSEELLRDFRAAEKIVLREAVFCSMVSTCKSLELWPARAGLKADDVMYQDVSEPLERIAQRLYNYVEMRRAEGEEQTHSRLMLAASFVVEFGRAHGLPGKQIDPVAEEMLMAFLARVKEWGEKNKRQELSPCLDPLPTSLRRKAEDWWKANWKGVAIGAGILMAGAALIGAGIMLASGASASRTAPTAPAGASPAPGGGDHSRAGSGASRSASRGRC